VCKQALYLVRERWLRFKLLLEFADDELRRTNPELCVPAPQPRKSCSRALRFWPVCSSHACAKP
jgi:hypothetical protein